MAFNYSPKVITNGLVLYLDAANSRSYTSGSSTWNDLSRTGNKGVLTNGPTYNSANGGSIVFDGVDDYVNYGNISNLNFERTDNFSFCFWIYPTTFTPNGGIASKYDNTDKGWTIGIGSGGLGLVSLVLRNTLITNDIVVQTANNSIVINTWYFVVITYNGSSNASGISFYINGVKTTNDVIARNGLTANISNTANALIGGRLTNDVYYTGRMSIFSSYNKVLTQSEIQQNYNALKGRFGL